MQKTELNCSQSKHLNNLLQYRGSHDCNTEVKPGRKYFHSCETVHKKGRKRKNQMIIWKENPLKIVNRIRFKELRKSESQIVWKKWSVKEEKAKIGTCTKKKISERFASNTTTTPKPLTSSMLKLKNELRELKLMKDEIELKKQNRRLVEKIKKENAQKVSFYFVKIEDQIRNMSAKNYSLNHGLASVQ